ncbi:hypothetical protein BZA77DRAFT_361785 [Pyronema omphalodes]|nr:hypothetical protein BZA77DRAFT_361785 [Pyronema omphalodes]
MNHSRISALSLLGVNQDNKETHRRFDTDEEKMYDISHHINDRFDAVLAKLNDLHSENAKLRAAYDCTQAETAALKAAVAALTGKIDEQQQVISAPPLTQPYGLFLSDGRDDYATVCRPTWHSGCPGRCSQPSWQEKAKGKRPEHQTHRTDKPKTGEPQTKSDITGAKPDALERCDYRSPGQAGCPQPYAPLPLLAITSTEATPEPHPDSSSAQDTPLPDAPSTAPAETNGWKTVEAKATQKKKMKAKETTSTAAIPRQTPTTKNGGRGKNTHQPRQTTPSAKKTWAEVLKSGGINVQIVLGNGNLGLTTPPTRRGERRGGAARRLRKKEGERKSGEEKQGRAGPGVSKCHGSPHTPSLGAFPPAPRHELSLGPPQSLPERPQLCEQRPIPDILRWRCLRVPVPRSSPSSPIASPRVPRSPVESPRSRYNITELSSTRRLCLLSLDYSSTSPSVPPFVHAP